MISFEVDHFEFFILNQNEVGLKKMQYFFIKYEDTK